MISVKLINLCNYYTAICPDGSFCPKKCCKWRASATGWVVVILTMLFVALVPWMECAVHVVGGVVLFSFPLFLKLL